MLLPTVFKNQLKRGVFDSENLCRSEFRSIWVVLAHFNNFLTRQKRLKINNFSPSVVASGMKLHKSFFRLWKRRMNSRYLWSGHEWSYKSIKVYPKTVIKTSVGISIDRNSDRWPEIDTKWPYFPPGRTIGRNSDRCSQNLKITASIGIPTDVSESQWSCAFKQCNLKLTVGIPTVQRMWATAGFHSLRGWHRTVRAISSAQDLHEIRMHLYMPDRRLF